MKARLAALEAIASHDAVDRAAADWNGIRVDGVAGCFDRGNLTGAAVDGLANGEDTRCAGDTDGVDRAEGWVNGKLLLQVQGRAYELKDCIGTAGRGACAWTRVGGGVCNVC